MLSGFLDWFEENKVGVIGTLTLHSMVLFVCTMVSLRPAPDPEDSNEMRVDVMQVEEAEQVIENIIRKEQGLPEKVTNLTSNTTAQVRPSFSQAKLAERVEQDVRAFEQQAFDEAAKNREQQGKTMPEVPELDPSKWRKELYMEKPAEPARVEGAALVEHDLRDRVRGEGKPGYLCKEQGIVVVRISVGRDGRVKRAEYDPSASVGVNECMLDQALLSVRNTPFNASTAAPEPQTGTITFRFVPQ